MKLIKEIKVFTTVCKSFAAVVMLAASLLCCTASFAQKVINLPPRSPFAPDLQILIVGGMPGADLVNVTYPNLAKPSQLQQDLAALSAELNVDPETAHITATGLPNQDGSQTPPMTSFTLKVKDAAPLDTGRLPVDKIILGLRAYHRLAITYIMPPRYMYNGFHKFSDKDVSISVTQSYSNCSFVVQIFNQNMTSLTLPVADAVAIASQKSAQQARGRATMLWRAGGIIFLSAFAVLIGWGVYTALAKMQ